MVGIELQISGPDCIQGYRLHFGVYHLTEIKLAFLACLLAALAVHVSLKFVVGHLVPLLVLAVPLAVFLDGVVGEVDNFLADVVEVELVRRSADVALAEPVGPHDSVETTDHHIVPNVEFASFV